MILYQYNMSEKINFELLNINIPDFIKNYPIDKQKEIYDYLTHLNDHDRKAYEIAFDHLGSSFNIYRSNGFKEWKQSASK